jgi:hypothetical protein
MGLNPSPCSGKPVNDNLKYDTAFSYRSSQPETSKQNDPEDGGNIFLRNINKLLLEYTAVVPGR